MIGKTIKGDDDNTTYLVIPNKFAIALGIENSKVSLSVLDDFQGNKHLLVTKFQNEIVIE